MKKNKMSENKKNLKRKKKIENIWRPNQTQ